MSAGNPPLALLIRISQGLNYHLLGHGRHGPSSSQHLAGARGCWALAINRPNQSPGRLRVALGHAPQRVHGFIAGASVLVGQGRRQRLYRAREYRETSAQCDCGTLPNVCIGVFQGCQQTRPCGRPGLSQGLRRVSPHLWQVLQRCQERLNDLRLSWSNTPKSASRRPAGGRLTIVLELSQQQRDRRPCLMPDLTHRVCRLPSHERVSVTQRSCQRSNPPGGLAAGSSQHPSGNVSVISPPCVQHSRPISICPRRP